MSNGQQQGQDFNNGTRREDPAGTYRKQSMIHELRVNAATIFWSIFWGVIAFRIANGVVDGLVRFWNWMG